MTTTREESEVVASRTAATATKASQTQAAAPDERDTTRFTVTRQLSPAQARQVEELRRVDSQVREHEAAHLRAGQGVVTTGASFSFAYGPDGVAYAVAGEVGIDTSPEDEARANIDKGRQIQVAALAPSDPSPQDFRVAAVGGQLETRGRSDLADQLALERTQAVAKNQAQREATQARQEQRIEAAVNQAQRVGEDQNAEPSAPSAGENDLTRQRLANAYRPAALAAANFSVFA